MNQIINNILNKSILLIALIAVPINISVFFLLADKPYHYFRIINLLLGISIILLYIFRNRIKPIPKAWTLVALVLLRGFYALCFGLLNIAGLWFVLAIIFTLLISSGKYALRVYIITLLFTVVTGLFISTQFPYFPLQYGFEKSGFAPTGIEILHFLLIGYLSYYIIFHFINNLKVQAEQKRKLNERYLNAIISTEEKERKRIAEDLHDGLGPVLSATKLYFQAYTDCPKSEDKKELKKKINDIIENALDDVSRIAHNTSPNILYTCGITTALEEFINSQASVADIRFHLQMTELPRYKESIELSLYRIITELVNNTLKHAGAKNIVICTEITVNNLYILYKDDGCGLHDKAASGSGAGLGNIRNRINVLNGEISFTRGEYRGVFVKIKIPCKYLVRRNDTDE